MKTDIKLGCFLSTICCITCDWFETPDVPFHRTICPKCGSAVESNCVGRFEIKETKSFFGTCKTEITGFKRRVSSTPDMLARKEELKKLIHHRDTTVGLWATDRPELFKDHPNFDLLFEIKD